MVLDNQHSSDVEVAINISDTSEVTVSASTLTFGNSNFDIAQTITVTCIEDFYDNDNVGYTKTIDPSSSISSYNSMASSPLTDYNIDNDTTAISVDAKSGNTSEFGSTATINVTPATNPTYNVSIVVTDNDSTEVTISPTTLTITLSWRNKANKHTRLTGQNDSDNGNITYRVSFANATSSDSKHNGLASSPANIEVVNVDDMSD